MNYSNMTFQEILRIAEPKTELERILIQKYEESMEAEIEEALELFDDANNFESIRRIRYLEELLDEHEIKFNK